MTIEVLAVNQVTDTQRQQTEEILRGFISEEFPDVDTTTGGVLYTRVIQPNGLLGAIQQENFDRLRQSQSLLLVEQDPTLAEDDVVDGILSNFLVSRQIGGNATGQIVIVLSALSTTIIAANTQFTASGLNFLASSAFAGVTDASLIQVTTDRLIQRRPDGTYGFLIDVTAEDVGEQYRVNKGTQFELDTSPANFVKAEANSDFTGGYDEESNQELINQISQGVSTKVLAGRSNIEGVIRENYARTTHVSIVGFGDAEMRRDRNNIFGISCGGKSDIYISPDIQPESTVFRLTGSRIGVTHSVRINIGRELFPGFYGVQQVLRAGDDALGTTGLAVTSLVRGVDVSDDDYVPDLRDKFGELSPLFAAFSRYQTAELIFTDDALIAATTAEYDVTLLGLPDIGSVQDTINDRDLRNPNADYLIRAAVPMLTGVSLIVDKLSSELSDEDEMTALENSIKEEVASRVNALGFSLGKLPASIVVAAASSLLTGSATVRSAVELSATLVRPDGFTIPYFNTKEIVVPNDSVNGVSQRTTLFFLKADDVLVTFNDLGVLEV